MEKDIYYDTSVLNNLCSIKNINSFNYFVNDVYKKRLIQKEFSYVISTPTLVIETLGLGKIKKLIRLEDLNKEVMKLIEQDGFQNPVALLDKIRGLILNQLRAVKQLQLPELRNMLVSKKGHYNTWWNENIIKLLESHFLGLDEQENILEHLSLEIIQDINYENFIPGQKLKSLTSHLLCYLYSCSQQQNKNFFMTRSVLKRARVLQFNGKGLIESGQDYAEMEFIHFVLMGHKRNHQCRPVRVFTYEGKQLTIARISAYKSTLEFVHEQFEDLRKKPIQFQPGIIHHLCPSTGRINGTTYVRKLIENFNNKDFVIKGLSIKSGKK